MNRKELGYAVAGMLGAVAAAGCALPERSGALALESQDAATSPAPELGVVALNLRIGYSNTLRKLGPNYHATSSDDKICRINQDTRHVTLYPSAKGTARITIRDAATGAENSFHVTCG